MSMEARDDARVPPVGPCRGSPFITQSAHGELQYGAYTVDGPTQQQIGHTSFDANGWASLAAGLAGLSSMRVASCQGRPMSRNLGNRRR